MDDRDGGKPLKLVASNRTTTDKLSVPKPIYARRTAVPTRLPQIESETNEGTYLLRTSNKHFAYIVMVIHEQD